MEIINDNGVIVDTKKHLESWSSFIELIATMFNKGMTEEQISDELKHSKVIWEGEVASIKLDEEYAPGVSLSMKPDLFDIDEGKVLRTDHIFLNINNNKKSDWRRIQVGDRVIFEAIIASSSGLFPEIQLSEDKDDPEVLLMVGLFDCTLVGLS